MRKSDPALVLPLKLQDQVTYILMASIKKKKKSFGDGGNGKRVELRFFLGPPVLTF